MPYPLPSLTPSLPPSLLPSVPPSLVHSLSSLLVPSLSLFLYFPLSLFSSCLVTDGAGRTPGLLSSMLTRERSPPCLPPHVPSTLLAFHSHQGNRVTPVSHCTLYTLFTTSSADGSHWLCMGQSQNALWVRPYLLLTTPPYVRHALRDPPTDVYSVKPPLACQDACIKGPKPLQIMQITTCL